MPASVPGDLISSPNSVCPYGLEMSLRSSAPPRCGPRYRPVQVNGATGAGRGADARGGPSAAAVPATKSSASTAPARRKTTRFIGEAPARGAHPLARGDRASVSCAVPPMALLRLTFQIRQRVTVRSRSSIRCTDSAASPRDATPCMTARSSPRPRQDRLSRRLSGCHALGTMMQERKGRRRTP